MDKAKFHLFHLLELNLTVYQLTIEMVDLDLESDLVEASYFLDQFDQNLLLLVLGSGLGQMDILTAVHIQADTHSVAKNEYLSSA